MATERWVVVDLNMLRYAVMGHQQSAQHSADVAQDTLVNMAGFFHTLRMARPDDSDDLSLPVPGEYCQHYPELRHLHDTPHDLTLTYKLYYNLDWVHAYSFIALKFMMNEQR